MLIRTEKCNLCPTRRLIGTLPAAARGRADLIRAEAPRRGEYERRNPTPRALLPPRRPSVTKASGCHLRGQTTAAKWSRPEFSLDQDVSASPSGDPGRCCSFRLLHPVKNSPFMRPAAGFATPCPTSSKHPGRRGTTAVPVVFHVLKSSYGEALARR